MSAASSQEGAEVPEEVQGKPQEEAPQEEESTPKPLTEKERLNAVLERAKGFHSPYLRSFEKAIDSGLVKELMDDPFPSRWVIAGHDHSMLKFSKGSITDHDHWLHESVGLPRLPKNSECKFEEDKDYDGIDIAHYEGLTDQECCDMCTNMGKKCWVAIMSGPQDEPPRACWLKYGTQGHTDKKGVRACWPPGREPGLDWEYIRKTQEADPRNRGRRR